MVRVILTFLLLINLNNALAQTKLEKELKPMAYCVGMALGFYKYVESEIVDKFNEGFYEDKPNQEQEDNAFLHTLEKFTHALNDELKTVEEIVCGEDKSPCYAVVNEYVDKSMKLIDDLVIEYEKDETVFENELFEDFTDKCFDYINMKELS